MSLIEANREQLHYHLIRSGFTRTGSRKFDVYRKQYAIGEVVFPIKLIIADPLFVTKPIVLLEEKPAGLALNVPHLIADKELCYLDDAGVEFDIYRPVENICIVLEMLGSLLHTYAEEPGLLEEEFRREITAYWQPHNTRAYMISQGDGGDLKFSVFRRTSVLVEDSEEVVIADSYEAINEWRRVRTTTGKTPVIGTGFVLDLPENIRLDLKRWPPASLSELICWLESANLKPLVQRLVDKGMSLIEEENACVVVLRLRGMLFGALCTYMAPASKKLVKERLLSSRQRAKGKNRAGKSTTFSEKVALLRGLERFEKDSGFSRFSISDATPALVHSRNLLEGKHLGGLKIAIIGCGTVGGYATSLLFQAGAGSFGGSLSLYDDDELSPENLGRHYLDASWIGDNKARALAADISSKAVHRPVIEGLAQRFNPLDLDGVAQFDLIVDATGDIAFSSALCHALHHAELPVPVVYGWVDARGLAARGILDENRSPYACYGCLRQRASGGEMSERFPLFQQGNEIPEWRPRPCGIGGYLPFSSQASVTAAGLIQALCIGWINADPSPRFRHVSLDKRVIHTKSSNPTRLSSCPTCQMQSP